MPFHSIRFDYLCLPSLATIIIHSVCKFQVWLLVINNNNIVTRYRFVSLDLCITRALHSSVYCLAFCYLVGVLFNRQNQCIGKKFSFRFAASVTVRS